LPNSGCIRGQSAVAEGTEEPNHVLLFAIFKLAAMQKAKQNVAVLKASVQ